MSDKKIHLVIVTGMSGAGKTVANARGKWEGMELIDIPGCYSLAASSPEEAVAREQICSKECDGVIVVCDGTCLERNLILTLQILRYRRDRKSVV